MLQLRPHVRKTPGAGAQLCALQDDDHAAFHRLKARQAVADIHHVGSVWLRLDPGVTPERMLAELDTWLLPQRKREAFKDGLASGEIPTPPAYDPPWCPATPTVQELYPFGYVRHADGSVDASIKSPG